MGQTKGATNRTPRVREAESKHLKKETTLQREIEDQKNTIEALRRKNE